MYSRLSNFVKNYYCQYYNGLVLLQKFLSEEHFHLFLVILRLVLPSNFIVSGVKSSR